MTDFTKIKLQYDEYAEDYHKKLTTPEFSFWNTYLERPAMIDLLKDGLKGKNVLDIGCGSGLFTRILKDMGANVIGSDLSEGLIEIARRENSDIDFFVENAISTNFQNNEFDLVTSSMMVHYFNDLNELFLEINRILKHGGEFVFSMHHPFKDALKKEIVDGQKKYFISKYHGIDEFPFEMEGMKLLAYTHSIQVIFDALVDSGFEVKRIVEPLPIKEAEKIDKEDYDKCSIMPTIIIFKAVKIN